MNESEVCNEKNLLICDKYDMPLKFCEDENLYSLDFEINKNLDVDKFTNLEIYNLIYNFNTDLIENIKIISDLNSDEIKLLILFKRLFKNIGIPQKYLLIKITKKKTDNLVEFISEDTEDIKDTYKDLIINADKILCNFSKLSITKLDNKIKCNYLFDIDIKEELPFLENYVGLLIKKISYNFKFLLEKK